MKSSVNDSAENKQDLLLFAYLEGELNETQKRELEAKLLTDPGLQLEMESWQEAFIEQDFYDTHRLEESLMDIAGIRLKPWYTQVSLYMFVCVLGISLFSFLPLNKQEGAVIKAPVSDQTIAAAETEEMKQQKKAAPDKEVSFMEIEPTKLQPERSISIGEQAEAPELGSVFPKTTQGKLASSIRENKASVEKFISEKPAEKTLPEIASLGAALISTISNQAIPEIVPEKVKIKQEASHAISRKDQRSIRRKKEKALQERKAREFIKGNRPYVVPLNTQNF